MKFYIYFFAGLCLLTSSANGVFAQKNLTIILLRHAEKDISARANKADPVLSAEGERRADRLLGTLKIYNPTQVFSTNYLRTMATVTPLAENLDDNYRIQIQRYDDGELESFAAQLLKIRSGTIVVAGHSMSTPMLANLLIKSDKYGALGDAEYNKIWIIKIKKGKIEDAVIEY